MNTELNVLKELINKIKGASIFERIFTWGKIRRVANETLGIVDNLKCAENAGQKSLINNLPNIAVTTPLSTKLTVIEQFFCVQVDGYILGDLAKMMAIMPDVNGYAGCAIPPVMTMIAAMEMFGTFLTNNPDDLRGRDYLVQFITDYMPSVIPKDRDSLVFNYRHKLMHVFFARMDAKKIYGITKLPSNTTDLIDHSNGLYRTLNVPKLYSIFLGAVALLRTQIFIDNNLRIIDLIYNNFPQITTPQIPPSSPVNSSFNDRSKSSTITNHTTIAPGI